MRYKYPVFSDAAKSKLKQNKGIDLELASRLLDIQEKNLQAQVKQFENEDKADERNYEYSKKILEVQAEDLKDERTSTKSL